jgi:pyrroloquinoline quinone biosynthesis protein D
MSDAAPSAELRLASPRLRRGVRLRRSEAHGGWVVLAPERVLKTDEIGAEILKRCTGEASLGAIVADLAASFGAPPERVEADVRAFLGMLDERGYLDGPR